MNEISSVWQRLSCLAVIADDDDENGGDCGGVNKCTVIITNGMVMDSTSDYNKNGL